MKLSRNQGHAKAVGVTRIVTDHFVHFLRMHMTRRTTIKLELYIVVGREEMAFCQVSLLSGHVFRASSLIVGLIV